MLERIVAIAAAYLIGSIPFAFLLARRWGTADIRHVGSGNVGATNVFRIHGVRRGAAVAFLDITKGAVSVVLAERVSGGSTAVAAALAAIVGHVCPVWLGFRGGKGIATSCGAFLILAPMATLLATAMFVVTLVISRYVSLASILASFTLPSAAYVIGSPTLVTAAAGAAALIVLCSHRGNIGRLREGPEPRIATKGPRA